MKNNNVTKKKLWVLLFWVDSCTTSVTSYASINEIIDASDIYVGKICELPWREKKKTTAYLAKILYVSDNKKFLESFIIDVSGKIVKKPINPIIMSEIKAAKAFKRTETAVLVQSKRQLDDNVRGKSLFNSKKCTKSFRTFMENDKNQEKISIDDLEGDQKQNSETNSVCENCKYCVCHSWSKRITPEIQSFLKIFTLSLTSHNDAEAALRISDDDLEVELSAGTGVFVKQTVLNWAISKANGNVRKLIWNVVTSIINEDEILKYETSEGVSKAKPTLKPAVIGYVRKIDKQIITSTLYNDVVNKHMQSLKAKKVSKPAVVNQEMTAKSDTIERNDDFLPRSLEQDQNYLFDNQINDDTEDQRTESLVLTTKKEPRKRGRPRKNVTNISVSTDTVVSNDEEELQINKIEKVTHRKKTSVSRASEVTENEYSPINDCEEPMKRKKKEKRAEKKIKRKNSCNGKLTVDTLEHHGDDQNIDKPDIQFVINDVNKNDSTRIIKKKKKHTDKINDDNVANDHISDKCIEDETYCRQNTNGGNTQQVDLDNNGNLKKKKKKKEESKSTKLNANINQNKGDTQTADASEILTLTINNVEVKNESKKIKKKPKISNVSDQVLEQTTESMLYNEEVVSEGESSGSLESENEADSAIEPSVSSVIMKKQTFNAENYEKKIVADHRGQESHTVLNPMNSANSMQTEPVFYNNRWYWHDAINNIWYIYDNMTQTWMLNNPSSAATNDFNTDQPESATSMNFSALITL